MDWEDALEQSEAAILNSDDIRAGLPFAFVLEHFGVEYNTGADGKLHAVCPFHNDHDPSLDVFGENLSRFDCKPCGARGDVFEFIKNFLKLDSFPAVLKEAETLRKEAIGWVGPTQAAVKTQDLDFLAVVWAETQLNHDITLLAALLEEKNTPFSEIWLNEEFQVGVYNSWVVIPYFDSLGELRTLKHREKGTKPHSLSGSGAAYKDLLYGIWRDTKVKPVLLCAGESDTWSATYQVGAEFDVLGIPMGETSPPTLGQVNYLADRDVVLAFDGDPAGRRGMQTWAKMLIQEGCNVWTISLADGEDISSTYNLGELLADKRPVMPPPVGLLTTPGGYVKEQGQKNLPVSNWTFEAIRELRNSRTSAFEGLIHPGSKPAVVQLSDLASKSRIVGWASSQGVAWYGSDTDAQVLQGMLQAQSPFLSRGKMASVAGLSGTQFVWDNGYTGDKAIKYVPLLPINLEGKTFLSQNDWDPQQILTLRELHDHKVTDPILAWLAAAPIRSLVKQFPILSLMGPAGTGKTTLLENMMEAFSGTHLLITLTSTTQHSLFAYLSGTNAFPVLVDEYRKEARKDTKMAFDQSIRDAFTGEAGAKGGISGDWREVIDLPLMAPIAIAGEDAFRETSHIERMAMMQMPTRGANPDILREVVSWGHTGLPRAYLEFISEGLQTSNLPPIANFETGPSNLASRQRVTFGVLVLGWELLNTFLQRYGFEMSDPDWSLVIDEAHTVARSSPIEQALIWALDEPDCRPFVFQRNEAGVDFVYIKVPNFVHYISRNTDFILPGNTESVLKYLENKYQAVEKMVNVGGQKSFLAIKRNKLN